ncbi:trypsin-like peptidase domain-containing protein [Sinisalibacter aestuarii]|uniref:Peptidoglycan-binding protein n=1 Tax=Sinisalibacter aestuarii TaxID=2949426 RepID=A0ABQ5LQE8_9RHOB|nr:trypsin-like peptidase domain-containing protein [Sinisalibacter aestuarii]GKY87227.1 peptidoglycan-binding protein [Sinisalibacter aestuarii]
MRRAFSAIVIFVSLFVAGAAVAQQSFWVQIQATPTLRDAEDAARRYAQTIPDVNGFRLGASGWYAVALGPYTEAAATDRLLDLRARAEIPGDAYIANSDAYGQQFWPVGANALANAPVAVPADEPAPEAVADEAPVAEAEPAAEPAPEPQPVLVEETRAEALASERLLDGDQRKLLQIALRWEGFYTSLIDGDFGPGTRGAMAAWQAARGYEETGVLTTRQRNALVQGYTDMLASMGLAPVTDAQAGISVTLPGAMVGFTRYEAPFAHYEGDEGVRVVLISQRGDKATLYGLYDILQTLEVVPVDGERQRRDSDFAIEGANDEIVTYAYATLADGAVKGFMLIWPQGARVTDAQTGAVSYEVDRRRALVLDAMRESFASTGPAVLDDNAGLDTATQSIDLVSGLEIRRAEKARSGFFISPEGAVITTTEAVDGCTRITLDESYEAKVTALDGDLGIALLMPVQPLAPMAVGELLSFEPRLQSELAVAGYSYGGRLSSPTLTFGKLADVKGLAGETTVSRLDIRAQDGDTGGPVLDQGGAVVGMLLASPSGDGRLLPADVGFAAKSETLVGFLTANGVPVAATDIQGALTPYDLSALAADITVLVSCWK